MITISIYRLRDEKGLFLSMLSNCFSKDSLTVESLKQNAYSKQQDAMLKEIQKAKQMFDSKYNPDELISVYEKVLVHTDEPLKSEACITELIGLYLINGYNNKAWGYLSSLLRSGYYPLDKIRTAQARILKTEKKDLDTIEKYMQAHLASSFGKGLFSENSFLNDISVSVKRLKWDERTTAELTGIISNQIRNRDMNEHTLINRYWSYLESNRLN